MAVLSAIARRTASASASALWPRGLAGWTPPSFVSPIATLATPRYSSTPSRPQRCTRLLHAPSLRPRFAPSSAIAVSPELLRPGALMGVRTMFIQTQPTPNPDSLKFLPGCEVLGDEFGMVSMDFTAGSENSARSELARKLLAIKSVTRVFFAHDFISITKDDATPWEELKPHVFACIMDFFGTGKPIIEAASEDGAIDPNAVTDDDDEIVVLIKELLETRIRPAVQEDGGDILFHRFEPDTGLVLLQLAGSCAGCPSSSVTLKSGVENMLMHYIPEVEGVVAVDEAGDEQPSVLSFQPTTNV